MFARLLRLIAAQRWFELALASLLITVVAVSAAPAQADHPIPRPAPGQPWFGPELNIETAVPQDYADALGASPSSFTFQVDYPLSREDQVYLERQVRAIAALGAVAVVDLQPRTGLTDLTSEDALALGDLLDGLHDELGTWFLARFGAEMNGSWEPWGQQAVAFKAAFRLLAHGLDATAPSVETVWSPVYGSGYPFRAEQGADGDTGLLGEVEVEPLDTNGDGRLDPGDDPYGPYFPGDDVVDWVGLTLYRFGQDQGIESNVVPDGEYDARLAETWGYGDGAGRRPFYQRFAEADGRPMMVQTSALYNPAVGGASEHALKRSWWRQVFGASPAYPLIGLISWLEVDRIEPEVDSTAVDWRVTAEPEIAAAIRADLDASSIDLGPVSAAVVDTTVRDSFGGQGHDIDPSSDIPPAVTPEVTSRSLAVAGATLLLALVVAGVARRRRPPWADPGQSKPRDPRLDLVRGVLIVLVVVAHLVVVLGRTDVVRTALGAVPVPEALVLVSGLALGAATGVRHVRRALRLYAAAVLTALLVYVVSRIPGTDLHRLTTFRDPSGGRLRNLYPDADHLFDYPTPWEPARRLLFLEMGPWVTSWLGLFVLLGLLCPLVLLLLRRSPLWITLALSWAVWGLAQVWHPSWTPAQAADAYPPLAWQVLFVHGLVLARNAGTVRAFLASRVATLLLGVLVASGSVVAVWASVTGHEPDPQLVAGVDLPVGRLLVVVLVAGTTAQLLYACWRPLAASVGRAAIPLGRHGLVIALAQVPLLVVAAALVG